jgi:hypothetical protein
MAMPTQKNLTLYQGDNFQLLFRLKDDDGVYLDLTGCTPKSQVKDSVGGTLIVEFVADLADQTTTPGGVLLSLDHTAATGVANGVWDFQVTYPDGSVYTYLYGTVTVTGEVTT